MDLLPGILVRLLAKISKCARGSMASRGELNPDIPTASDGCLRENELFFLPTSTTHSTEIFCMMTQPFVHNPESKPVSLKVEKDFLRMDSIELLVLPNYFWEIHILCIKYWTIFIVGSCNEWIIETVFRMNVPNKRLHRKQNLNVWLRNVNILFALKNMWGRKLLAGVSQTRNTSLNFYAVVLIYSCVKHIKQFHHWSWYSTFPMEPRVLERRSKYYRRIWLWINIIVSLMTWNSIKSGSIFKIISH